MKSARRIQFSVAAVVPLILLFGCGEAQDEERADPRPVPAAWFHVALQVTGPEANHDKYRRCVDVARDYGIGVQANAKTQARLFLQSDGNRLTVQREGRVFLDEARPGWPMLGLCIDAFAIAAEAAGRRPTVSKAEPGPACTERGGVDSGMPMPYDLALRAVKLRALQRNLNYVVLDGMAGYSGSSSVSLKGRGYTCAAGEGEPVAAPRGGCVPDCSPGFACFEGRCISACNPPCSGDQHCGADRLCH